jgi:hypothetical protein
MQRRHLRDPGNGEKMGLHRPYKKNDRASSYFFYS